jgi:hypothetical protein
MRTRCRGSWSSASTPLDVITQWNVGGRPF